MAVSSQCVNHLQDWHSAPTPQKGVLLAALFGPNEPIRNPQIGKYMYRRGPAKVHTPAKLLLQGSQRWDCDFTKAPDW